MSERRAELARAIPSEEEEDEVKPYKERCRGESERPQLLLFGQNAVISQRIVINRTYLNYLINEETPDMGFASCPGNGNARTETEET